MNNLTFLESLFNLISEEKEENNKSYFINNIESDTIKNTNFRKVLFTSENIQLVVMSLSPNTDIGEEVHNDIDQFIRVEKGKGKAVIDSKEHDLHDGISLIIPKGTKHNIINNNSEDLKLYTIYSPPNHQKNVIHRTKKDAEKNELHFDGKTDV